MRSAPTKKCDESLTFLHVFDAGHMAPPWISQVVELAPELAAHSQKLTEASQAIKLRKREKEELAAQNARLLQELTDALETIKLRKSEQEELTARERSLQDKLSEVAEGIKLSSGKGRRRIWPTRNSQKVY